MFISEKNNSLFEYCHASMLRMFGQVYLVYNYHIGKEFKAVNHILMYLHLVSNSGPPRRYLSHTHTHWSNCSNC